MTITVADADDTGILTLSTEHPGVDAPVTATLTDEDGGVTNEVWAWESSADGSTGWTAIPGTGTSSYTPVQGDIGKYLRVTVTYDDTHGSGKTLTEQADSPVRTNAAPTFDSETATRSVAENTPAGRNIGAPVTATDSDAGDELTYSLGGTDVGSFSIVPETGQLRTKAALDYERRRSYSVVVTATDRPGATDTIAVTINVTDVDEAPRGRNLTPLRVSFSRSSYSVDEGDDVTVRVTVSPAADRSLSIPVSASSANAESGDYSVSGTPLSFAPGDTSKSFTVSTASDSDSDDETVSLSFGSLPSGVSTGTNATARVTIEESSESSGENRRSARSDSGRGGAKFTPQQSNQAPEFTEGGNAQRTVAENSAIPTNLGSPVSATDLDGDKLTYTLGGPDAASFTMDYSTGQLKTATDLDYETKASYFVV